jgi:predicted nucleic acid-binding protein
MASVPCPKAGGAQRWRQRQRQCSPRILPAVFCPSMRGAAARYPEIVLARRQAGNPIEKFDALIAATALAAGACIATRDIGGFAGCGITLVNPWEAT